MTSAEGRRRVRIERGIYRQGNGKFAVWVMVAGRPRFRTVDAATVAEARQRRALLQMLAASGELPLSPRLTFSEVAARWLAEFERKVASDTRRERTVDLYRSQLRLYLLPTFGRRRIGTIGPDDVARFAGDLSTRGLSAWSIKRLLGALSCVLSFALRRGYISRHPFAALTRDERPHPRSSEQRVLTRSELARLLSACPPRYRPLLVTAAYTGMRLSELLGLAWDDVDFRAGVVRVRHQLARSRGGVPAHRVAPKTAASVREIPLLPQLAAVLREQRRGSSFTASSDYVFVSGRGTPLLHHNVSKRVLRRAAAAAGLDRDGHRVRFHDLRHTFASHLIIDVRLDVAQVSRILGHARTSMTLDTYTHLFEQARHTRELRAELAKSEFAMLLARLSNPPARVQPGERSSYGATPERARGPAFLPIRTRTRSGSASPALPRAAAASAPRCCAGRSRSARSRNGSCPSARPAAPA